MGMYDTLIKDNDIQIQVKCYCNYLGYYTIGQRIPTILGRSSYNILDTSTGYVAMIRNTVLKDIKKYHDMDPFKDFIATYNKYGQCLYLRNERDYIKFLNGKETSYSRLIKETNNIKRIEDTIIGISSKNINRKMISKFDIEQKRTIALFLLTNPLILDHDASRDIPDYYQYTFDYILNKKRERGNIK